MSEHHQHQTHPEIVKRLRRAEGHLKTIIQMIVDGRSCVDVAQQLHAVEKAVAVAKKTLIHDYIDHCLEQTDGTGPKSVRTSIAEFKEISKYL